MRLSLSRLDLFLFWVLPSTTLLDRILFKPPVGLVNPVVDVDNGGSGSL